MRRLTRFTALGMMATCLVVLGLSVRTAGERRQDAPQFVLAPGSLVAVGPMAQKVLVADLNGDDKPDIVLTCGGMTGGKPDPKQGYVAVLAGDGRGGFKMAQQLIPIGMDGSKAAVGDLNNDKRPDIVVIAHDSYTVTLLFQDERGQFDANRKRTVLASQGNRPHTHDVAIADMNGDGNLDVLTTNEDDGNVSVLLGDGTGGLTAAKGSPFAAGRDPYEGLSVGDVNGDRKLDIVVPNLLGKAVSVLLGDGRGGFAAASGSPVAVWDRPGFVTLGDVTGDSLVDIVVTHDDDPIVYVLRGDGRGGFQPTAGSPVRLKENVWGAVIADMNGDGKTDLVLGGKQGHVLLLLGDGAGGFAKEPILLPVGGKGPGNVAVADVNRDRKPDVITSNFESGNVSVLLQR
jgi:hypothetical protein